MIRWRKVGRKYGSLRQIRFSSPKYGHYFFSKALLYEKRSIVALGFAMRPGIPSHRSMHDRENSRCGRMGRYGRHSRSADAPNRSSPGLVCRPGTNRHEAEACQQQSRRHVGRSGIPCAGSDVLVGKDGAKSSYETLHYESDSVRQGKWKLVHYRIEADRFTELYDLETDLGERISIADQYPKRVKAMKTGLDAHVAEIKQNSRPTGFVENPKPLLVDTSGLPTLAEFVGHTGVETRKDTWSESASPTKTMRELPIFTQQGGTPMLRGCCSTELG